MILSTFQDRKSLKKKKEKCVFSNKYIFFFSDEPEDFTIKEEPIDEYENQSYNLTPDITNYNNPNITVKQEFEEFEYEFGGNVIKLDIGINNHLVIKQEPSIIDESEISQESIDTADNTQESDGTDQETNLQDLSNERGTRTYTCRKCGFTAKHKRYRQHIEMDCKKSFHKLKNLVCTKCEWEFSTMKKYLNHFVEHGYEHLSCPECLKQFFSFTKLTPHVQSHIRKTFVRVKLITLSGNVLLSLGYLI